MADNISAASTEDPWCDSTNPRVVPLSLVEEARQTIMTPDGITMTPCIRAKFSDIIGAEVYLKLENFNVTGSFKERGARFTMMKLDDEKKQKGVVAASLGNHSQGVSLHGGKLGIPVTVVMPVTAPLMKINKCKRYGANVVVQGQNMTDAKKIARDMAREKGMTFINGYDHPHVLAGQGVVGLEILDQVGKPDAVIVPCGGGGLMAGVTLVIKEKCPSCEMIGVEAENCPGFSTAMKLGRAKRIDCRQSIADGLAVAKVGYNVVATCLGRVDHTVTVSESLINVSMTLLIELEKIITEGAGASPLAALLSGQLRHLKGKKIVCVCSGGNVDTPMLLRVVERGLATLGRYVKCSVWISDRIGGQSELLKIVNDLGVNVKHMHSERAWVSFDDFTVRVNLLCETRDIDNAIELRGVLQGKYEKTEFPDFPNACRARCLSQLQM